MTRFRQICGNIAGFILNAGALLAVLKFGSFSGLPEQPVYYPNELWEYLLVPFPPLAFAILGGAALFFSVLGRYPERGYLATAAERGAWLLGAGVALAALPGAINAPTQFLLKHLFNHYFGMGAWIVAVGIYFSDHPEKFPRFCRFAVVGVLLTVAAGIYQYFWGFAETREWIAAEIAAGKSVSPLVLARANDTRIFATVNTPGALAGVILLTLPLVAITAAEWGKKLDPATISVPLTVGIAAGATVAVGLATKSRTAFASALIVALAAGLLSRRSRRQKLWGCVAALLIIISGALYIQWRGRGFASLAERLDYCRTGVIMTAEAPLSGHGWGSFQTRHRQLRRSSVVESARDPHNAILAFAASCGILPGLIVATALGYLLVNLYRRRENSRYSAAIFWGFAAFNLQALLEMHHLIPGVWGLAGALAVGVLAEPTAPLPSPHLTANRIIGGVLALFSLGLMINSGYLISEECAWAKLQQSDAPDCTPLLRRYPDHPYLVRFAGDLAAARGNLPEAEKLYRRTLTLSQPPAEFYVRFATLLQAQGKTAEAEAARRTAHTLAPRSF